MCRLSSPYRWRFAIILNVTDYYFGKKSAGNSVGCGGWCNVSTFRPSASKAIKSPARRLRVALLPR